MPKHLESYGLTQEYYEDTASMMELAHQFHSRIVTNSQFNGSRCIGCILTEYALALNIGRMQPAKYLWDVLRVASFVRFDTGLEEEENGVRRMMEIPSIDAKLDRAVAVGALGVATRSHIRLANPPGIRAAVKQQMEIAFDVMQKGLVPYMQFEVDIASPERHKCELLLQSVLLGKLDEFGSGQKVVLSLTLPAKRSTYMRLIAHQNVLRVGALCGGLHRDEACERLQKNLGMVPAFGRAFAEGFHVTQTEKEFTTKLTTVCKLLYNSSRGEECEDLSPSDIKHRFSNSSLLSADLDLAAASVTVDQIVGA